MELVEILNMDAHLPKDIFSHKPAISLSIFQGVRFHAVSEMALLNHVDSEVVRTESYQIPMKVNLG
jgi:hypothetical protein